MSSTKNTRGSNPAENRSQEVHSTPSFTQAKLLAHLTECDSATQETTDQIEAMAKAAQALLSLDANSLLHVHALLQAIVDKAMFLSDDINCIAEGCGAAYRDENQRTLQTRLWAQHHALRAQ